MPYLIIRVYSYKTLYKNLTNSHVLLLIFYKLVAYSFAKPANANYNNVVFEKQNKNKRHDYFTLLQDNFKA